MLERGVSELEGEGVWVGRCADVVPVEQVLLQVHVAEVDRQVIKELGVTVRALGNTFQGGVFPGNPFAAAIGLGRLG